MLNACTGVRLGWWCPRFTPLADVGGRLKSLVWDLSEWDSSDGLTWIWNVCCHRNWIWNKEQIKVIKCIFLVLKRYLIGPQNHIYRADSRLAPSQWETVLLCNDIYNWLGTNRESALIYIWQMLLQPRWGHSCQIWSWYITYVTRILIILKKKRKMTEQKKLA